MNISYDVWSTLIKGNKEFRKKRIELASQMFNISEDIIDARTNLVKKANDLLVDTTGIQPNTISSYRVILSNPPDYALISFIQEVNQLFLKYPPTKINEIIDSKKAIPFITCNTAMIPGRIMREYLKNTFDIPEQSMKFSDEVGVSKPNLAMFEAHKVKLDFHIGDNFITDGACKELGIKFINISDYSKFKKDYENNY